MRQIICLYIIEFWAVGRKFLKKMFIYPRSFSKIYCMYWAFTPGGLFGRLGVRILGWFRLHNGGQITAAHITAE